MISNLDDKPYTEVMDMLEGLAVKHDLLLSLNLINFADELWKIASNNSELVSALHGAIRLAQENAPDMIDDDDFTDRLNGALAVLWKWSGK
jgi:hypothetical protein